MEKLRAFDILPQPCDNTCGPTCLHAIYRHYGDEMPLEQVVAEVPFLESGGTLGVLLACHALARGYHARIYTYNLQMFDPTWFRPGVSDLPERLAEQLQRKQGDARLSMATPAYQEFLDRGGELRLEDLTTTLIRKYLKRGMPVLCGLSSTFLYRTARESPPTFDPDDVGGDPAGHFVVLYGYDAETREVQVADPLHTNPMAGRLFYSVSIDRVICAVLLGIVTYDANLLIIQPPQARHQAHADSHSR